MNTGFSYKFSVKESIVGLLIFVLIFFSGKWAYFFLPREYAESAQIPTYEIIFSVCIMLLFMYIYKIGKEINDIKKRLKEIGNNMGSNLDI